MHAQPSNRESWSLDIHPEHLLDKLALRDLSPAENEQLMHHLAACATCRFELQLRADFAAERCRGEAQTPDRWLFEEALPF